ncbi:DUF3857 domain-containing protein [Chitinophaga sp. Cy-1792]|uniref:DUF3857 domain-containing protein n=1 Tax=Chitinophaga sp. Cy-1792 TaxID=2608339 RepID=UPI001423D809|nr:DUF3857 domain-containing protein [Chitinophaga sp. Cy-1792]NIG53500.1 hypothetical protein [Chitinophaga sp. Cy-1792]
MQRLIFFLTFSCLLTLSRPGKAQDGSFAEGWTKDARKHTVPTGQMYNVPYFLLLTREIVNFNIDSRDKADGYSYYQTLYKSLQIQQDLDPDKFDNLEIKLKSYEEPRSMHIRKISADGTATDLERSVRLNRNRDGSSEIKVTGLALRKGDELEYELISKVRGAYAGIMTIQSDIPCAAAEFRLMTPKTMEFLVKSNAADVSPTESLEGNSRLYAATVHNIPPIVVNDLYNVQSFLTRIEFGLFSITENGKTSKLTWDDFGKQTYVPYVALSKNEAKQVEKELGSLPFLKNRMPVQQTIYMVEQYVKSNYEVYQYPGEFDQPGDLAVAIRAKRTDKVGIIRLLNAFYYYLNIPTQLLFTSARDNVPLSRDYINPDLAENTLIYFPNQGQAMAPTDFSSRYPCYPTPWINQLAVRCRDTLVGQESQVLTDMMNTPIPPYTFSNISLDATLTDFNNPTWDITQSLGGYAGLNVKNVFTRTAKNHDDNERNKVLNAIIPISPEERKVVKFEASNEVFTAQPMDQPAVLKSTINTPKLIVSQNNTKELRLGEMLAGAIVLSPNLPPAGFPVQLAFPFYYESRIHLDLPAGYKIKNKADFNVNINSKDEKLGLKMRIVQEDSKVHIYLIEWFKDVDFYNQDKETFQQVIQRVNILRQQVLTLEK